MTGAAAAIGAGFLASLADFGGSPWALVPVALAVIMLAARWRLGRRSRVTRLALVPPLPCPCCTGRPMEHPDCTCQEPCGWQYCPALDPGDDTIAEFGHDLDKEIDDILRRRGRG